MTTIGELMTLERILLEINVRFKFTFSYGDAYKLYTYLKDIGRMTNLYFQLLDEFYTKYHDKDELEKYKSRLSGSDVEFNTDEIKMFIDGVFDAVDDQDFKNIVLKNRFWKN